MQEDSFGTTHTTASSLAVAAFEAAVHGVAAHRPGTGEALERALAADPALVSAHALRGFANVILAREELGTAAGQAYADALASRLAKGGSTEGERAMTEALGLALEGRFFAAASRLDAHLDVHPRAFLHAKIAHSLRFMVGDVRGMLLGTARVIDAWSEDQPGYGYLLGCHAFALEEGGDLEAAERIGRRAVELAPDDAWGLHAVSHVHEMQGRTDEGIGWIEAKRPVWSACNNFSFHMAWHLALFHLERGEHERVLALYDAEVRPKPTDDFRDMANAVSLLWRLEQEGAAVGGRWEELRILANRRRADTTLTFAALHNMLALVAAGDIAAARELAGAIAHKASGARQRSDQPSARAGAACDQADVLDGVGCDLAQVILSLGDHSLRRNSSSASIASRLQRIGGSHAQRDVFLRTLAAVAVDAKDAAALDQVLAVRRRIKRDDRYAHDLRTRLKGRSATIHRLSA